jgi:hypothetical protein
MAGKVRIHGLPYAAQFVGNSWHIVVPISGRLAPMVLRSKAFQSQNEAGEWLKSEAGRELVARVQVNRSLPE